MKSTLLIALILTCFSSGCATYHLNKPVLDDGSPIAQGSNPDLRDAILSGIQLAHPELSLEQAEELAKDFYKDNKSELNMRYKQSRSMVTIARYVSYLINGQSNKGETEPFEFYQAN